jgi:uncharacterized protein YkwD
MLATATATTAATGAVAGAATGAAAEWAIRLAMGVLAVALLGAAVRDAAPAATAVATAAAPASAGAEQRGLARIVALSNGKRAAAGVAPMTDDAQLTRAAQRYAEALTGTACFGHNCGPLPRLADRVAAAGGDRWGFLGENVAAGQRTPERVVAAWMASPPHRANLLNPQFTRLGVGRAAGGPYGTYWTQEFGTPAAPAGR